MNRSDVNIKIGKRITSLQNKADLTQDELPERIGISQKHLPGIKNPQKNENLFDKHSFV